MNDLEDTHGRREDQNHEGNEERGRDGVRDIGDTDKEDKDIENDDLVVLCFGNCISAHH